MDPLSQGTLGAALPQSFAKNKKEIFYATAIGWVSGMLPDLDVLISSSEDPLLFLEYHRQFTHSLIFIPIGALIAALAMLPFFRKKLAFKRIYFYAFLGYATHGLLDACTTYGTLLFWPFSDFRVAWNNISIIDPLFTLPLLLGVVLSLKRKKILFARLAMMWVIFYLLLGLFQEHRAKSFAQKIALSRGHAPQRLEVYPTLGNLWLFRSVYQHEKRYHVDALHVLLEKRYREGSSVPMYQHSQTPWLEAHSQQAQDIERFRWFSKDYLYIHPKDSRVIGDVRYSMLAHSTLPLWGIRLNPLKQNKHVRYEYFRDGGKSNRQAYWELLSGRGTRGLE